MRLETPPESSNPTPNWNNPSDFGIPKFKNFQAWDQRYPIFFSFGFFFPSRIGEFLQCGHGEAAADRGIPGIFLWIHSAAAQHWRQEMVREGSGKVGIPAGKVGIPAGKAGIPVGKVGIPAGKVGILVGKVLSLFQACIPKGML